MNKPSQPPAAYRKPYVIFLGACIVTLCSMGLCVVLFIAGNAGYWMMRQRSGEVTNAVTQSQPVQSIQAALNDLPQGDSTSGERIYSDSGGCSACHSLEPGDRKVGPSLSGIASRSTTLRKDYSAEMYIYESITSPASFVAEGYPGNVMPEGYAKRLSKQELADLLAFLMTK